MKRLLMALVLSGTWLSPAFGATASTTATAYEVEVLIFEASLSEWEAGEVWTRENIQPPDMSQAIATGSVPTGSALANAATALQNDKRYRVLLHKRWVQNTETKAVASPVQLSTENKELEGIARFYVNRFLHVELNLVFQPAGGALGSSGTTNVYQINDQRRIKSQDLNYFDHPKFGVLVRVVPASG